MALAAPPLSISFFLTPFSNVGTRLRGLCFPAARFRASSSSSSSSSSSWSFPSDVPVPDCLSSDWLETRKKRPFGPRLNFSAEEAVQWQLDALKYNDQPRQDYGIEVMYRFAGFDPFERSTYFGPFFDLGQSIGGSWDGYWLTESLHLDGDGFSGGIAY
ncbi:hypothetical protein Taro_047139 [Colocasia esculenta]|uniref:Uncharacterized protein n=1 Tax=Colocasia esculenta TaxID=4460 RepID=A0A843X3F4_COLES|nr:hypothetical protein [Colocasia esculenta]